MLDRPKLESWLCKLITILIFYHCIANFTNLAAWNSHWLPPSSGSQESGHGMTEASAQGLTAEIKVSASAGFSSTAQGPCPGSFRCQQHSVPCGLFEVLIFFLAVDLECSQHLEAVTKSLRCGSSISPPTVPSLIFWKGPAPHLIKASVHRITPSLIYSKSAYQGP